MFRFIRYLFIFYFAYNVWFVGEIPQARGSFSASVTRPKIPLTRGETRPDDDLDTGSYQFVVSDVLFIYYMNSVSGVFDYDLNRFQIFHLCRLFYFILIVFHLLYLYLLFETFVLLVELCCNTLQQ